MASIVGISGSLRAKSFNTALLHAAVGLMPSGSTLDVRTLHGIPLFNGDDETAHGIPPAVVALKDAIAAADGVILATPEYNNSIPGVLKNAVDWCSRPPADIRRVFGGKPVAIVGASAGNFGTILAQTAWLPVLRTLGADTWNGARLMLPRSREAFDDAGVLVDEALSDRLRKLLEDFCRFVDSR